LTSQLPDFDFLDLSPYIRNSRVRTRVSSFTMSDEYKTYKCRNKTRNECIPHYTPSHNTLRHIVRHISCLLGTF